VVYVGTKYVVNGDTGEGMGARQGEQLRLTEAEQLALIKLAAGGDPQRHPPVHLIVHLMVNNAIT
jgi:hypothetical protein